MPRLRPIRCRCGDHRATRWCNAATFISSRRAALRRSRRRPCQDSRCRRRLTSIGLKTQWNWGTYVKSSTTLVEQFSSQVSTTPYPSRAGSFFLPPYQGAELPRAACSFRRRRESQTFRSAVPSAAVIFVAVLVVVGPSDLGLCLTGALHYTANPWT